MTDAPDFPRTAEEARLDRDATREELTETLNALAHKLDVKQRLTERVDHTLEQTKAKVADVMPPPAADKFSRAVEVVRNNPLPFLAALVTFLLVLRRRSRRNRT